MNFFENIDNEELEDKVGNEDFINHMNDENSTDNLKENDQTDDDSTKQEKPKKIEIINGNGDLNISPVSDYLEVEKPKPKDHRTIIIPEVKDNITGAEKNGEKEE